MADSPQGPQNREQGPQSGHQPGRVDFGTFILSLASSAMVHLGKVPDPTGGQPEVNLELARQTIDILMLLREKTQGNLNQNEALLLERVLHDVRLAFVDQANKLAS